MQMRWQQARTLQSGCISEFIVKWRPSLVACPVTRNAKVSCMLASWNWRAVSPQCPPLSFRLGAGFYEWTECIFSIKQVTIFNSMSCIYGGFCLCHNDAVRGRKESEREKKNAVCFARLKSPSRSHTVDAVRYTDSMLNSALAAKYQGN